MTPASLRALSVLAFLLLMVGALVLLFSTGALFSGAPLAVAFQSAAVALMLWARVAFGLRSFHAAADPTAGGVVRAGPYRFVRHPIYAAVCLFGWTGVVAHWSLTSALLGVLLFLGAFGRMLCEEHLLFERYPEYREYARRTKRMLPGVF